MLNVKVIVGSTREGRFSEKLLPWITAALSARDNITHEVIDLRDYDLPFYDQPTSPAGVVDGVYPNEAATQLAATVADADAFLVIAPEYNHGYTAVLKNAFDSIYAEWNKKAVGFVSYGGVGGGRVVEQLRQVAVGLQMAPVRNTVHIQAPWFMLDETGSLKDGVLTDYDEALAGTLDQLQWWGDALRVARSAA